MSFRIIRASLSFGVVLVVTPADAKPGDEGAKYHEYHPGRAAPGWNNEGFNETSWKNDARFLFSGQADGLGYAELPEETFPTLEAVLAFVEKKRAEKS